MKYILVLGKGGVGKTTFSATLGLKYSKKGRTLVASLDPAHNLGDVFQVKLSGKEREIADNLYAVEVDLDKAVRDYIGKLESSLKHTYRYLTVINLDKYFEVLRNYPGVEESALLEAMMGLMRRDYDTVIFDTPPTGLTIRILALAEMTLLWLDKLIEIRRKILERRKAVKNIQGEICIVIDGEKYEVPTEEEDDAVLKEMIAYRKEVEDFVNSLRDKQSSTFYAVLNPEPLSLNETRRIAKTLREMKINLDAVVINKFVDGEYSRKIEEEFRQCKIYRIPVIENPIGLDGLKRVGQHIGD